MRKTNQGPVWGEATPQFPPLVGTHVADVVVIGLGASGLVAARETARRGLKVIGIDAGAIAGGAAGRNGGFLMAGLAIQYDEAQDLLGAERAETWFGATEDELRRVTRDYSSAVNNTQSFRVAEVGEELAAVRRDFEAREHDGFAVSWFSNDHGEGFLSRLDGAFNPLERCRLLTAEAAKVDVLLAERTPALSISENIVEIPNGEIRCRVVLVAVDGGLDKVVPTLASRVRSTRLQMLCSEPIADRLISYPTYSRWGFDYYQQLPGGEIAMGGFRDTHLEDEWDQPSEPSAALQSDLDALLAKVTKRHPRVTHRWAGLVSYTVDGLPICEEVIKNVYAFGAYCGLGNVMGTLCAKATVGHLFGESALFDTIRSDVRPHAALTYSERSSA